MSLPSLADLYTSGPAVLRARWYLRSAAKLGPRTRLWGRPVVHNFGKLLIGDRVRIVSTTFPVELQAAKGACLEIADDVFINCGVSIGATLSVRIGKGSSIGSHVTLMDNDFHRLEPERRNEMPPSAPIVLEENVWLGVRVVVLRGVTIGAGSVVGAGSIVVRDIPPRTLVAGVPAKVIRSL